MNSVTRLQADIITGFIGGRCTVTISIEILDSVSDFHALEYDKNDCWTQKSTIQNMDDDYPENNHIKYH